MPRPTGKSLWDLVTVDEVVKSLTYFARRDFKRLETNWKDSKSIWGLVSSRLFDKNNDKNRFWLSVVYKENRQKVKDAVAEACKIPIQDLNKSKVLDSTIVFNCFCKKRETVGDFNQSFIKCDNCDVWYHCVCISISNVSAYEEKDFKCAICTGGKGYHIPEILRISVPSENIGNRTISAGNEVEKDDISLDDEELDYQPKTSTPINKRIGKQSSFPLQDISDVEQFLNIPLKIETFYPEPEIGNPVLGAIFTVRAKSLIDSPDKGSEGIDVATSSGPASFEESFIQDWNSLPNREEIEAIDANSDESIQHNNDKNRAINDSEGEEKPITTKRSQQIHETFEASGDKIVNDSKFEGKVDKPEFESILDSDKNEDKQEVETLSGVDSEIDVDEQNGENLPDLDFDEEDEQEEESLPDINSDKSNDERDDENLPDLDFDKEEDEQECESLLDLDSDESKDEHEDNEDEVMSKKKQKNVKESKKCKGILSESSAENGSNQSGNDSDDAEEYEGFNEDETQYLPSFKFNIPAKIFETIEPTDNGRGNLKLQPGWTDIFYEHFKKKIYSCVLKADGNNVNQPGVVDGQKTAFIRTRWTCKYASCPMKYLMDVMHVPNFTTDVEVKVRCLGADAVHTKCERMSRQLRGKRREKVKKKLKHTKAAKVRLDQLDKADDRALDARNMTDVNSRNVLRICKHEEKKGGPAGKPQNRFQELTDLALKFKEEMPSSSVSGWIQSVTAFPFMVTMLAKEPLEVLKTLVSEEEETNLFIDSTGNIVQEKICPPSKQKPLLFSVVAHDRLSKRFLPVCESITINNPTSKHIRNFLSEFLDSYRKVTGGRDKHPILRTSSDFSKPIISAVLSAFDAGDTLSYVNRCFKDLKKKKKKKKFVHHVCGWHVLRFLKKNFQEAYGNLKSDNKATVLKLLMKWAYSFVNCTNLHSFARRVKIIITILGNQFMTSEVQEAINNMDKPTTIIGDPMENFDEKKHAEEPTRIYQKSHFGHFALDLCRKLGIHVEFGKQKINVMEDELDTFLDANDITDDDSDDEQKPYLKKPQKNDFFSKTLLKYLLVEVLPYAPFLTKMMLQLRGFDTKIHTNYAAESYFNILKNVIGHKNMYLVRFLDEQLKFVLATSREIKRDYKHELAKRNIQLKKLMKQPIVKINERKDTVAKKKTEDEEKLKKEKPKVVPEKPLLKKGHPIMKLVENVIKVTEKVKPKVIFPKKKTEKTRLTFSQRNADKKLEQKDFLTYGKFTDITEWKKLQNDHPDISSGCDFENFNEIWKSDLGKAPQKRVYNWLSSCNLILWGGIVEINKSLYKFTNTCCLDNGLQILYVLYNMDTLSKEYIDRHIELNMEEPFISLKTIFLLLSESKDNEAKLLWINNVLKWDWDKKDGLSLWGTEETRFYDKIEDLVQMKSHYECDGVDDCRQREPRSIKTFNIAGKDVESFCSEVNDGKQVRTCSFCEKPSILKHEFFEDEPLPFIIVSLMTKNNPNPCYEKDLPEYVNILGFRYKTFCCSISENGVHFITCFRLGKRRLIYDGQNVRDSPFLQVKMQAPLQPVNIVWLLYSPSNSIGY